MKANEESDIKSVIDIEKVFSKDVAVDVNKRSDSVQIWRALGQGAAHVAHRSPAGETRRTYLLWSEDFYALAIKQWKAMWSLKTADNNQMSAAFQNVQKEVNSYNKKTAAVAPLRPALARLALLRKHSAATRIPHAIKHGFGITTYR
jgi:hypothetical protein